MKGNAVTDMQPEPKYECTPKPKSIFDAALTVKNLRIRWERYKRQRAV